MMRGISEILDDLEKVIRELNIKVSKDLEKYEVSIRQMAEGRTPMQG